MLAGTIGGARWVQPEDIVNENPKLNLFFVANLFKIQNGLVLTAEMGRSTLYLGVPLCSNSYALQRKSTPILKWRTLKERGKFCEAHQQAGLSRSKCGNACSEERTFRMWITSMNIETPVHNLSEDFKSGVAILELEVPSAARSTHSLCSRETLQDKIVDNCVDWTQVNKRMYLFLSVLAATPSKVHVQRKQARRCMS